MWTIRRPGESGLALLKQRCLIIVNVQGGSQFLRDIGE